MNPNNSKRVRYAPVNVSAILTDKESVVSLFALCVPVLMVPNMTGIFDAGKNELQRKNNVCFEQKWTCNFCHTIYSKNKVANKKKIQVAYKKSNELQKLRQYKKVAQ